VSLDELPLRTAWWFFPLVAFVFGCNIGSFLNVCIFRTPRDCLTVNHPRWSFCPLCRRRLRWYENQPLIGWLLLRGRCGGCASPISLRYPLFEGITGLLWAAAALRWLAPPQLHPMAFLVTVIFLSMLLVAAMIDVDLRILPDRLTLPGMVLFPLASLLAPRLYPGVFENVGLSWRSRLEGPLSWWGHETLSSGLLGFVESLETLPGPALRALAASLGGLLLGGAMIWSIAILGRGAFARDVMGFGDVKFMAMIGAFTGPRGAVMVVILGCFLGAVGGLLWKLFVGRSELAAIELEQNPSHNGLGVVGQAILRLLPRQSITLADGRPGLRYSWPLSWLARLVTGDATIPFGPALALGAAAMALMPEKIETLLWQSPALWAGGM